MTRFCTCAGKRVSLVATCAAFEVASPPNASGFPTLSPRRPRLMRRARKIWTQRMNPRLTSVAADEPERNWLAAPQRNRWHLRPAGLDFDEDGFIAASFAPRLDYSRHAGCRALDVAHEAPRPRRPKFVKRDYGPVSRPPRDQVAHPALACVEVAVPIAVARASTRRTPNAVISIFRGLGRF